MLHFRIIIYKLKRIYHFFKTGLFQAVPAMIKYKFPQRNLLIVGVSGTDGKTTTSTLIHHILDYCQIKTGLITTLGAKIGNKTIDTGLHVTNPTPNLTYQLLKLMKEQGCSHVVLEMTSHGAYQFRNFGIRPSVGAITNINHEHYDYHQNLEEYIKAKAGLFRFTPLVYTDQQNEFLPYLKKFLGQKLKIFSQKNRINRDIDDAITARFVEKYNQFNARLACVICLHLELKPTQIAQAIASFPNVPCRMQIVPNDRGFVTMIDFAHTPQAIAAALKSLRLQLKNKNSRLIAVLGSAGQRDTTKRPLMGEMATTYADLVIFTAEDPRKENVWTIINQLKSYLGKNHSKVISIADRGAAIYYAVNHLARKGDLVVLLGKGHEQSMCFGKHEYQWSDLQALTIALNQQLPTLGQQII